MSIPREPSARDATQLPSSQPGFEQWSRASQLDFEIGFLERVVACDGCYVDALRVLAETLTHRRAYRRGLQIDQRLVRLRPDDPVARYNLACSYALVRAHKLAVLALRKAIELGYDDLDFLQNDPDLDNLRDVPEYRMLMKEYASCHRRSGSPRHHG